MQEHTTARGRPGWLRRFAAGAWHVPGGALFLLRHPRLWTLAALPAVLGLVALIAGGILGIFTVRTVEAAVEGYGPKLPDLPDLVRILGLWVGTLASGLLLSLSVVLLATAPLLECLGRRAEALAGGNVPTRLPTWRELPAAFARALGLFAAVLAGFVMSLVPFLGLLLTVLFVGQALAIHQTAYALARRGHDLHSGLRWHQAWRAESLGFGVAGLVLLPLASPVILPALAIGAALLVHEIEDLHTTAPAEPNPPSPLATEPKSGDDEEEEFG